MVVSTALICEILLLTVSGLQFSFRQWPKTHLLPIDQRGCQVICFVSTYQPTNLTYLHFLFLLLSLYPLSCVSPTLLFLHYILNFFFHSIASFLLFLLSIDFLCLPPSFIMPVPLHSILFAFSPLSQSFFSSSSLLPSLPPQVPHPHVKTGFWWLPRREQAL